MMTFVVVFIFSYFAEAQEGPLVGACPRMERAKIGACFEAVSQICHSGSQCICAYCGPRQTMRVNQSRVACGLRGRHCPPSPIEGRPVTCTDVCLEPTRVCEPVTITCQQFIRMGEPPPVEPHICTDPCPPCPPPGPGEFFCEGPPCSQSPACS